MTLPTPPADGHSGPYETESATRISDSEMTSGLTRHTARAAEGGGWTVSWLPGRTLTQNQAVTAMTIAEAVAEHAADLADNGSKWWLHIDQWAAELAITGPYAVAEASLSPDDRAAWPRVRVIFPERGPVGYLLASDPATGKATVRIDGVTVTMDACRLQYIDPAAAPAAGDGPETAEDDGDGAWAAPADGRGNGLLDLTHPERSGFVNVMTGHERSVLLAYIAGYAPEVFDHALAQRPETFPAELARRAEAKAEAEYMADPEGYCIACGENVAWFMGHDGPQHFRGPHKLVTGAERRELFTPDDGHTPQVAWRQPAEAQDTPDGEL